MELLRPLARVLSQPLRTGLFKYGFEKNVYSNAFPIVHNLCIRNFGAKPQIVGFVEKDTMSNRILKHMRANPEYAASQTPVLNYLDCNAFTTGSGIHQLLLVIAHSTELKASDILKLFMQYKSSQHSIFQDIIAKKSFMLTVKSKIIQMIPQMSQADLKNFAIILKDLHFKKSRYLIDIVANIGMECERRATEEADLVKCLELFDILMLLHENRIYRKKEYDLFISLFEMHIASAKPHHIVQILHYLGIGKKNKLFVEFVHSLVRKLDKCFPDLAFTDAGIAVGGIFKCNVKMDKSSSIIKNTVQHLQVKVEKSSSLNDLESFAFVAMIKFIRAAKYQDESLLPSITSFTMETDTNVLTPEVIAHMLALYANTKVYNPKVFSKLEQVVLHYLTESSQPVRVKDLSRILWSFSHMGHTISEVCLKRIKMCLMKNVFSGERDVHPEVLSGSLLSLAVMGYYPEELIKEAFKPERIQRIQGYQRSKQLSRLLTLHEAVKVELSEVIVPPPEASISDLPKRTIADEMHHRPALATLMKGANFINRAVGSSVFKLTFPVPHINYASLKLDIGGVKNLHNTRDNLPTKNFILQQLTAIRDTTSNDNIAIELLDSHSTLHGSLDPIGIVNLKIRLMIQCGWELQKIYEFDVNQFINDEQALAALILNALAKSSL